MGFRVRALPLVALVAALNGCGDHGVDTTAPKVPLAYTRFVNAVADTGGTDWRFIDQIENSPVAFGLTFRSFTPYQATAPGARLLRVFPASTDIDITSRRLIDTVLTLEADRYYTLVHIGYADAGRSPRHRILLVQDTIPSPPAGSVAIRALHLATGIAAVDVFASDAASTTPLPETPTFTGTQFASATRYSSVPAGSLKIRVTATDLRSPLLANADAPAGVAANAAQQLTAIGGSNISGSVISALFLPSSVPGSSAPQTPAAFASPSILYLIDRHPR